MKLLFDQNLSTQLVTQLANLYPDSRHVKTVGLTTASDSELWNYARENDYIIVSKDADCRDKSAIHGHPPKVIWLRLGNCPTKTVEDKLRSLHQAIRNFVSDPNRALLVLL